MVNHAESGDSIKDDYFAQLRSDLALGPGEIGAERVQTFIDDLEEHFDVGLNRGRTSFSIVKRLGKPRQLAQSFFAFAVVRSRRPAFTTKARIRHVGLSMRFTALSAPLTFPAPLILTILMAITIFIAWLMASAVAVSGFTLMGFLIWKLKFSFNLTMALWLFALGCESLAFLMFLIARRATRKLTGFSWLLWRWNANRRLELKLGER